MEKNIRWTLDVVCRNQFASENMKIVTIGVIVDGENISRIVPAITSKGNNKNRWKRWLRFGKKETKNKCE